MSQVVEILKTARRLIEKPENWTKGRFVAVNTQGGECFCSIGALDQAEINVIGDLNGSVPGEQAYRLLAGAAPNGLVVSFNDHPDTKHAEVLAMFDRAIEKAEKAA